MKWLLFWLTLAAAFATLGCRECSGRWPGQRALERFCYEKGICL